MAQSVDRSEHWIMRPQKAQSSIMRRHAVDTPQPARLEPLRYRSVTMTMPTPAAAPAIVAAPVAVPAVVAAPVAVPAATIIATIHRRAYHDRRSVIHRPGRCVIHRRRRLVINGLWRHIHRRGSHVNGIATIAGTQRHAWRIHAHRPIHVTRLCSASARKQGQRHTGNSGHGMDRTGFRHGNLLGGQRQPTCWTCLTDITYAKRPRQAACHKGKYRCGALICVSPNG